MDYDKIEEGKQYRITYKKTAERTVRQGIGVLPKSGTIVTVLKKDARCYVFPIRIIDETGIIHYTCHAADLWKEKKEER